MDESVNGSQEKEPTTREEIEARGGEIASEDVIEDTTADELRRRGISVDAFPPAAFGEITGDEESGE